MGNMGEISTAATGMQEKLLNGLRCVPLCQPHLRGMVGLVEGGKE